MGLRHGAPASGGASAPAVSASQWRMRRARRSRQPATDPPHRTDVRAGTTAPTRPEPERSSDDNGPSLLHHCPRAAAVLPGGRAVRRRDGRVAARLPDQLVHVPGPDPQAGRQLSPDRPRPPRLRTVRRTDGRRVQLHVRRTRRAHGGFAEPARGRSVRHVRAGLRRAGGLAAGPAQSGLDIGDHHPERQRLRRRLRAGLLEALCGRTGSTRPRRPRPPSGAR